MTGWLDRLNRIPWSRTLALFLAGPALTLFAAWLVWIVWQGQWPADMAGRRLDIIGRALFAVLIAILAVVLVIAAIARLRIQGPGGTSVEVEAPSSIAPSEPSVGPKP